MDRSNVDPCALAKSLRFIRFINTALGYTRATIHRPSYLDYVGVKRFDEEGRVIGERRFLGLYTTAAYKASAREIPLLRGKVEHVLARAGFPPDSHDAKALLEILESYPRDSLFQVEAEGLLCDFPPLRIGAALQPRS